MCQQLWLVHLHVHAQRSHEAPLRVSSSSLLPCEVEEVRRGKLTSSGWHNEGRRVCVCTAGIFSQSFWGGGKTPASGSEVRSERWTLEQLALVLRCDATHRLQPGVGLVRMKMLNSVSGRISDFTS